MPSLLLFLHSLIIFILCFVNKLVEYFTLFFNFLLTLSLYSISLSEPNCFLFPLLTVCHMFSNPMSLFLLMSLSFLILYTMYRLYFVLSLFPFFSYYCFFFAYLLPLLVDGNLNIALLVSLRHKPATYKCNNSLNLDLVKLFNKCALFSVCPPPLPRRKAN